MNTRCWITGAILLAAFTCFGQFTIGAEKEERLSFVTRRGESIENAKIVRIEPDGISVMHACGITKIAIEDMPADLRERFEMNAADATQFRSRQAAAIRQRQERERIISAQQAEMQRKLDQERDARRADRERAQDEAKKKVANYSWHPGGSYLFGKLVVLQGDKVLLHQANRIGNAGKHIVYLDDLPLSEQKRALWIHERMTADERRIGRELLSKQEHYVDFNAMKEARTAAQTERVKRQQDFNSAVDRRVNEGIQRAIHSGHIWPY